MDTSTGKIKMGNLIVLIAIICMAAGFLFLIQPFAMALYTLGFPVILIGVILINIGSHM